MAEDKCAALHAQAADDANPIMNVDWKDNTGHPITKNKTVAWVNDKPATVTITFDFPEGSPFDATQFQVPSKGIFEHVKFDAAPGNYRFHRAPPPTVRGFAGDPKIIIT